jgi:hypothetical protein
MNLEEKLNYLSNLGSVRLVFYPANWLFRNAPHWQARLNMEKDAVKIEIKGEELARIEDAVDSLLAKLPRPIGSDTNFISRWLR